MGNPSISVRKYYRLLPGEASEPTSTLVLTSKDAYFVDIRILLEPFHQHQGSAALPEKCLDWAFAGKSSMSKAEKNEKGETVFWHNTWEHWIDSKSDAPDSDEGDMTLQSDSTVLEEGTNVDATTGTVEHYQELWQDLPVDAIGKKRNRSSLVLRADCPDENVKGLMVKVGSWCQGIVKTDGKLTIERWRRQPKGSNEGNGSSAQGDESTRTRNDWIRVFRMGNGAMPIETVCSQTDGRFGLNAKVKAADEVNWRVIEEYYY